MGQRDPSGRKPEFPEGEVSAGAPEPELWPGSRPWRHMWRHLGGLGLVAVVVYQLVASEIFGFGLRHCQSYGGVLSHVFVCECL